MNAKATARCPSDNVLASHNGTSRAFSGTTAHKTYGHGRTQVGSGYSWSLLLAPRSTHLRNLSYARVQASKISFTFVRKRFRRLY